MKKSTQILAQTPASFDGIVQGTACVLTQRQIVSVFGIVWLGSTVTWQQRSSHGQNANT